MRSEVGLCLCLGAELVNNERSVTAALYLYPGVLGHEVTAPVEALFPCDPRCCLTLIPS